MMSEPAAVRRNATDGVAHDRVGMMAAALTLFGLGAALFALDLATPLGVADGVGYAPLLALTLFLGGRRATVAWAFVFSLLIVVGHVLGVGGVGDAAIINRVLALISVWIVAGVVVERKAAQPYLAAAAGAALSWRERLFGSLPDRAAERASADVDRTIRDAANLYVRSYGDLAAPRARQRAANFLATGDREGHALWVLIADAIDVLQGGRSRVARL
jgi:hypothetical protein